MTLNLPLWIHLDGALLTSELEQRSKNIANEDYSRYEILLIKFVLVNRRDGRQDTSINNRLLVNFHGTLD